jgi:hypothetical protein
MTKRWGLRAGWLCRSAFDELEPFFGEQWFEVSLFLAGRRVPLFQCNNIRLTGRPPRAEAALVQYYRPEELAA